MSYYIVKVYGIYCDVARCSASEEYVPHIDEPNKLRETRAAISKQGWTFVDGKDCCPDHRPNRI